jgi:hypothetical protein
VKLSLCMIARDEERDLPRLLASARGLWDELVVVDTGSRDRTVELARAAGAVIAEIAWPDDFAAARNASLDLATGDWILVLDADEEVVDAGALRAELADADRIGLAGLSLLQRNLSPPGEATTYRDLPIVRAFRRGPRYEGRIHEQVSPAIARAGGAIGASDLHFIHHGYARTAAQGSDRARRNLALLEVAVRDAPGDRYLRYQLGATQKAVGDAGAEATLQQALAAPAGALSASAEADARMKLAQLALARGAEAEAFAEAQRCLAVDARNVIALQVTVVTAVGLNRVAELRAACTALVGRDDVAPAVRADAERVLQLLGVPRT